METKAMTSNNTKIYKKLMDFQREAGTISKDGKNPHFKSSYATLPNILSEVKPIMNKFGLILLQPVIGNSVYTNIIDSESGEIMESRMELPQGLNPQQLGSAITYFRRYLLAGLLSLELEDDDGNKASEVDSRVWLNEGSQQFSDAVKWLQQGNMIDSIEKKYKLSKVVREKLISLASV